MEDLGELDGESEVNLLAAQRIVNKKVARGVTTPPMIQKDDEDILVRFHKAKGFTVIGAVARP